jgi:hypothetical protein
VASARDKGRRFTAIDALPLRVRTLVLHEVLTNTLAENRTS